MRTLNRWIVLLTAVLWTAGLANAQNLLLNGDLNDPASGSLPTNWTRGSAAGWLDYKILDNVISHGHDNTGNYDGTYAVQMGVWMAAAESSVYQIVPGAPGDEYTLTCDSGAEAWWMPSSEIRLIFLDEASSELSRSVVVPTAAIPGNDVGVVMQPWTNSAVSPIGTTQVKVELAAMATPGTSGNSWFDNAVLTVVTNAGPPPCPTFTFSGPLPNGRLGSTYSQSITSSGGAAPYTFAMVSGTLPAGLSLNSNGAVTGTLDELGTYAFSVTATDTNGCTSTNSYSVIVHPEILLNGDFSQAPAIGWTTESGGGWIEYRILDTSKNGGANHGIYDGTYAMNIGSIWAPLSKVSQIAEGEPWLTYTLTCDSGAEAWWLPSGEIRLIFLNESGSVLSSNVVRTTDSIHNEYNGGAGDKNDIGVVMQRWTNSAVSPAGTARVKVEFAGGAVAAGGSCWFDNAVLAATNNPPVAGDFTLGLPVGGSATVDVVGKYVSDESDAVTITGFATLPVNGTVSIVGGTRITYTSTNSAANDTFAYTVSDGVATSSGTVTVNTYSPQGYNQLSTDGSVMKYLGIPGHAYALEHTPGLTPPTWTPVITNTAAWNGALTFTNIGPGFYRTHHVPVP